LASASALCILSAAGLIAASYFLNPLCFYLSPLALVLVCFYSLTKRFTDYTHVFLGIALALAPHWRVAGGEGRERFRLGDSADDHARGVCCAVASGGLTSLRIAGLRVRQVARLRSLVVAWGPQNALGAAFLAHMVMCGLLLAFGMLCHFRIAYLVGWAIIVGCLVMEHWIARRRSLNWINLAFFRLNAVVGAVFLIVVVAEVIFQGGFKLR